MAARPDITIDLLESFLDFMALRMVEDANHYAYMLPIYERVEREIAAMRTRDQRFASINERVKRMSDRMNTAA